MTISHSSSQEHDEARHMDEPTFHAPERQDDRSTGEFQPGINKAIGSVLILEDEPLIAVDLEYTLNTAGHAVHICSSCSEALTWLERKKPSVALLDVHLKDGPATEVASRLKLMGIPFIVCTGRDRTGAPDIFLKGSWLSKPCPPELLLKKVGDTLQPQR